MDDVTGKRYPESSEAFYVSRLPGTYEEERAGKRMKLPTPETWETQVSLRGNKARTWEDLIGKGSHHTLVRHWTAGHKVE